MRVLKPEEIECRLQTATEKQATYLLHKTARTDVSILSECYGDKWKNEFHNIDGKLFCTISVWNDEIKSWVSRSNVGTESNIEKEKGEASDAIKRAGFMWGIGSELYTAPTIKVDISSKDMYNGKCTLKLSVKEIEISKEHKITKLILTDKWGDIRFNWSLNQQQSNQPVAVAQQPSVSAKEPSEKEKKIKILRDAANSIYNKEGTNQAELKKFVDFYTKKIEGDGWKGDFRFDVLFASWMNRTKSSQQVCY